MTDGERSTGGEDLTAGGEDLAELFDQAPCGLLSLRSDGIVVAANRTVLAWLGRTRDDVVGTAYITDLLSVGGRMYWETHLSPLLQVEGRVDEVAIELRGTHGRMPVLLSAAGVPGAAGRPHLVRLALSSARERTRYERELLQARQAARHSEEQLRAVHLVTEALSQAAGLDAVVAALLDAALGPLRAAAATIWVTDASRGLVVSAARGEGVGDAALPDSGVVVHGLSAVRCAGRVVVPMHGHALLQGVLSLLPTSAAGAEALDLDVLTSVGRQAGLALDRARLFEQSAHVAHELQQSLLTAPPPPDDRFEVATVYRPGVETLDVGGDWYDVFLAADDVLAIVVGDVVGRGLAAASAMGQLRSAVRAVAGAEAGPGHLLTRLDRFVEQVEAAAMATLAYAELDLRTGLLRYACAGHPPPLLLSGPRTPQFLWEGRSMPLGAFLATPSRSEAQVQLQPGDRLLLYTDGLVERRDRALDDSLDVLARSAATLHATALDDAVHQLTAALLHDEKGRDDVCVLLLSWTGAVFEREITADLTGLSGVRASLRAWLHQQGVSDQTSDDLVLACSEAVANAAEHGGGFRADQRVRVRAHVEPVAGAQTDLVIAVRDAGHWRETSRSDERRRGFVIMRALTDDVVVHTGEGTTVLLRKRIVQGVR